MEKFYTYSKVLAATLLVSRDMYFAVTQPSIQDVINGAITGVVIYALFLAKERKHPQDEVLKRIAEGKQ